MTITDAHRELVLAVTSTLRDKHEGEHPSHEDIELELARRLTESLEMYREAQAEKARMMPYVQVSP